MDIERNNEFSSRRSGIDPIRPSGFHIDPPSLYTGECSEISVDQIESAIRAHIEHTIGILPSNPFLADIHFDQAVALRLATEHMQEQFAARGPTRRVIRHDNDKSTTLNAIAVKGFYHYLTRSECQDFVINPLPERADIQVAVVCDGVSACSHAHLGAALVGNYTREAVYEQFDNSHKEPFLTPENIAHIHVNVSKRLADFVAQLGIDPFLGQQYFATTVQTLVVIPGQEAFVFALGDGYWTLDGSIDSIESIVGRQKLFSANSPPLPYTAIMLRSFQENAFPEFKVSDTVIGRLLRRIINPETENEGARNREYSLEARGPYLVWQGVPEDLAGASLATDGVRFALESRNGRRSERDFTFPLYALLESHGDRPHLVQAYITLFNLATASEMMQFYDSHFKIRTEDCYDGVLSAAADLLLSIDAAPHAELLAFRNSLEEHIRFHRKYIETELPELPSGLSSLLLAIRDVDGLFIVDDERQEKISPADTRKMISVKGGLFACIQQSAREILKNNDLPFTGFHFMDDLGIVYIR